MHRTLNLTASTIPHTRMHVLIKHQDRKCYPSARLSYHPRGIWPTLYLLHRGQRGAVLCASNPSSFSAEASGLSWILHGSSPQIPVDEQNVECTSMGLYNRHNTLVCMKICRHSTKQHLATGWLYLLLHVHRLSEVPSPEAQPLWPCAAVFTTARGELLASQGTNLGMYGNRGGVQLPPSLRGWREVKEQDRCGLFTHTAPSEFSEWLCQLSI